MNVNAYLQFASSQNSMEQLLWNSSNVGVPAKNQSNHMLMKFWNNPKQSSTNSPTRPSMLTIGRTSKLTNQSIQGYHESQPQQVQVLFRNFQFIATSPIIIIYNIALTISDYDAHFTLWNIIITFIERICVMVMK